jgi:cell division protein FtsI/penicillin-binding protein 2
LKIASISCLLVLSFSAGSFAAPPERRLSAAARGCLAEKLAVVSEEKIPVGERDAFALMDPHSGRILWHRNPSVLARMAYQPGSIFKVIATYVAIDRDRVNPREVYRCQGGEVIEGDDKAPVRCWLRPGHGPVNLAKALALSCNLYFARLGTRLGAGLLLKGAREFGLGKSTGSDLPGENGGSLPSAAVVEQAARLAVGQGEQVRVTPLQVLSLIGAVANGGILYSPRRADPSGQETPVRGELKTPAALGFIRDALEEGSTFGTGMAQNLWKLRLAGKTGTAAWSVGWKTHAWYMGFAPFRNPRVVLVVFVHDGQGSKEGAMLARSVMETVYKAMQACK